MWRSIFFAVALLFLTLPVYVQGQPELGRQVEAKNVSQARSLAATNTLMPLAVGVGTVALIENGTLQTAGAALAVYGLSVGPSTANLYANDYARGMLGILARAGGAYLMQDATSEIFGRRFADALNVDNKEVSLTDTKILIGEILIIGSIVYNFVSAKQSVDQYNAARGARIRVSVEPFGGPFSPGITPVIKGRIPL